MYLKYSATTVDISIGVKTQGTQAPDSNTESHKSLTGKTVAVYETGPRMVQYQLQCSFIYSKTIELKNLWDLIDGPETIIIFRDKDGVDHNVRWIDEAFPIKETRFGTAEGTIMLEEV